MNTLILNRSYEALPPNFTALENMLAGGFAGVAVNFAPQPGGSNCHAELMGYKEHSVMYPVDMLKVISYSRGPFWLVSSLKLRRLASKY